MAAWLLWLKSKLRCRIEGGSCPSIPNVIDAREYNVALLSLITLVQRQEFPGLVEALASHPYYELTARERRTELQGQLKPMLKCCPFVENGLLHIGGHLQQLSEPYDASNHTTQKQSPDRINYNECASKVWSLRSNVCHQ